MTERAGDFNPRYIARLFMVNRDTSGYFFNYSDKTWSLWSFFSVQRGTRQICAMGFPEPTHTLNEGIFTVVVVLANNGVYCSQTYKKDPVAMPIQDCSQQCISLGSLDQFTQLMLVCGTNKGVYCARGEMHFNNTTEDLPSDPVSGFSCSWVRPLNALKVSAKSAGQRTSLKMFDAKGVLVFAKENLAFKNNRNLVLPVENSVFPEAGIYSVTMTGAWNSVVHKKKVLIIR